MIAGRISGPAPVGVVDREEADGAGGAVGPGDGAGGAGGPDGRAVVADDGAVVGSVGGSVVISAKPSGEGEPG